MLINSEMTSYPILISKTVISCQMISIAGCLRWDTASLTSISNRIILKIKYLARWASLKDYQWESFRVSRSSKNCLFKIKIIYNKHLTRKIKINNLSSQQLHKYKITKPKAILLRTILPNLIKTQVKINTSSQRSIWIIKNLNNR